MKGKLRFITSYAQIINYLYYLYLLLKTKINYLRKYIIKIIYIIGNYKII